MVIPGGHRGKSAVAVNGVDVSGFVKLNKFITGMGINSCQISGLLLLLLLHIIMFNKGIFICFINYVTENLINFNGKEADS